jgi:hypothetical protein
MSEYNLHTISAFDTPVYTGERVYPETREGDAMEAQLRKALTSKKWVAHKSRIWATGGQIVPDWDHMDEDNPGEPDPAYFKRVDTIDLATGEVLSPMKWDARGLSKVMGEFPGDNDSSFFPQEIVNRAHDTKIPEDMAHRPIFGVDIARFGADESVIFVNRNGHARLMETWGKSSTVESAKRIHKRAQEMNAAEVRIDASGVGGGVYDQLKEEAAYADKVYLLIGVDGGSQSPDKRKWSNARTHNHEQLRNAMLNGRLDLDYDDRELADQLLNMTFRFNTRGAIQITPKDEMKTVMGGSPDRLDALIYSVIDTSSLFAPPDAIQPGDIVLEDPWEMETNSWWANENYPL